MHAWLLVATLEWVQADKLGSNQEPPRMTVEVHWAGIVALIYRPAGRVAACEVVVCRTALAGKIAGVCRTALARKIAEVCVRGIWLHPRMRPELGNRSCDLLRT